MNNEQPVVEHYGTDPIEARVSEALRLAGMTSDRLDWEQLSPLDQFHSGGLFATRELAAALAVDAGAALLDVGSGLGGSARFLAATYGCHVTGVDLTPAFVDVAAMLSERSGADSRRRRRFCKPTRSICPSPPPRSMLSGPSTSR